MHRWNFQNAPLAFYLTEFCTGRKKSIRRIFSGQGYKCSVWKQVSTVLPTKQTVCMSAQSHATSISLPKGFPACMCFPLYPAGTEEGLQYQLREMARDTHPILAVWSAVSIPWNSLELCLCTVKPRGSSMWILEAEGCLPSCWWDVLSLPGLWIWLPCDYQSSVAHKSSAFFPELSPPHHKCFIWSIYDTVTAPWYESASYCLHSIEWREMKA